MNALPLVLWVLGFMFWCSLEEHWRRVDGKTLGAEWEPQEERKIMWGFWVVLVFVLYTWHVS